MAQVASKSCFCCSACQAVGLAVNCDKVKADSLEDGGKLTALGKMRGKKIVAKSGLRLQQLLLLSLL